MTCVLVKLRFWTFQLGSGSSHPGWMRKRYKNDKQMTQKWQQNGKKWRKNDNQMATKCNINDKKWHRKTGMIKKMTKPNDKTMTKKMTKINIQQPSEFAGKIFINLGHGMARSSSPNWTRNLDPPSISVARMDSEKQSSTSSNANKACCAPPPSCPVITTLHDNISHGMPETWSTYKLTGKKSWLQSFTGLKKRSKFT